MRDFQLNFLFNLGSHPVNLRENKAIIILLAADGRDQSEPLSNNLRSDHVNFSPKIFSNLYIDTEPPSCAESGMSGGDHLFCLTATPLPCNSAVVIHTDQRYSRRTFLTRRRDVVAICFG